MIDWFQVIAVCLVFLLLFEAVLVAARSSLLNINTARILSGLEQNKAVERALDLAQRPVELEASFHLAQLFCRFLIAGCILALIPRPLNDWLAIGEALTALLFSGIFLFLAEEFIKAVIIQRTEAWALRLAPFAGGLQAVFAPLLAAAMAFHSPESRDEAARVTEDELKSLVDAGHQGGVLETDEREMIYSIFQLGDTLAREIMVPRIYLTALDCNLLLEEAVEALLASGFSRLPVYEETIDRIIGVLYAKDLLRAWKKPGEPAVLKDLLRPAYFVPEAKRVDELLDEMQSRRVHMAIVVDEYGGVAGLVTLEDIVEEIVGEIHDEYDQGEELVCQQLDEDTYLFLGRVDLHDFNEIMNTNLSRDETETLGGFIYSQVGRVPVNGEKVQVGDVLLTVEQVSGRRIRKVRAERIIPPQVEDPEI